MSEDKEDVVEIYFGKGGGWNTRNGRMGERWISLRCFLVVISGVRDCWYFAFDGFW